MGIRIYLPEGGLWTRMLIVIHAVAIFIWLTLEDNETLLVAVLSASSASLVGVGWLLGRFGGKSAHVMIIVPGFALFGAIVGLGAGLGTAFLMFFKNAYHAHVFPDYPTAMILAILNRIPVWMLAGAFIGFGLILAWLAVSADSDEKRKLRDIGSYSNSISFGNENTPF